MIKLTSSNHSMWKPIIKDSLIVKMCINSFLAALEIGGYLRSGMEKLYRETISIDQCVFNHVSSEIIADVIWRKLKTMFERKHGLDKDSSLK